MSRIRAGRVPDASSGLSCIVTFCVDSDATLPVTPASTTQNRRPVFPSPSWRVSTVNSTVTGPTSIGRFGSAPRCAARSSSRSAPTKSANGTRRASSTLHPHRRATSWSTSRRIPTTYGPLHPANLWRQQDVQPLRGPAGYEDDAPNHNQDQQPEDPRSRERSRLGCRQQRPHWIVAPLTIQSISLPDRGSAAGCNTSSLWLGSIHARAICVAPVEQVILHCRNSAVVLPKGRESDVANWLFVTSPASMQN